VSDNAIVGKEQATEPPALPQEYYKTRRQLMLWSGILFAWELIGVDLEMAATAGGNVGTALKAIKSPQAIPWTILILVLYFLFRFSIEWRQASTSRRVLWPAKIDFFSSWTIAWLATSLYMGQRYAHFQVANNFVIDTVLTGVGVPFLFYVGWLLEFYSRRVIEGGRPFPFHWIGIACSVGALTLTIIGFWFVPEDQVRILVLSLIVSFVVPAVSLLAYWLIAPHRTGSQERRE